MNILITGANGQLGLELQKQLRQENKINNSLYNIIPTDRDTMDITNLGSIQATFGVAKPDIVINCAAHTAVDKCEEDQEGAYAINALGPRNLAIECEKIGAKLIQISTDYVFDGQFNNNYIKAKDTVLETRQTNGQASTPWKEDDPVAPQSIYGKTKLTGEEHVRNFCKKYFIIRTAWLYGEGNNFVRTMLKLAEENKTLRVVADQFGNPTSTKDLAKVIINLMHTEYYGIYHGTCEGICSWYTFAQKIFEIQNKDIRLIPVTSEQYPRPAKRPYYSALDNVKLKRHAMNEFRTWEEALEDYLKGEHEYGKN